MKRLYKRLLERNQHDRSRSPSFLEFHGFCRAQICNVALVILFVTASDLCTLFFPVSGGPDFNGVTEEYGCWRRGLLPAVRGAADVTRRDDGDVLTHFAF